MLVAVSIGAVGTVGTVGTVLNSLIFFRSGEALVDSSMTIVFVLVSCLRVQHTAKFNTNASVSRCVLVRESTRVYMVSIMSTSSGWRRAPTEAFLNAALATRRLAPSALGSAYEK